jgi:hypothetical protein
VRGKKLAKTKKGARSTRSQRLPEATPRPSPPAAPFESDKGAELAGGTAGTQGREDAPTSLDIATQLGVVPFWSDVERRSRTGDRLRKWLMLCLKCLGPIASFMKLRASGFLVGSSLPNAGHRSTWLSLLIPLTPLLASILIWVVAAFVVLVVGDKPAWILAPVRGLVDIVRLSIICFGVLVAYGLVGAATSQSTISSALKVFVLLVFLVASRAGVAILAHAEGTVLQVRRRSVTPTTRWFAAVLVGVSFAVGVTLDANRQTAADNIVLFLPAVAAALLWDRAISAFRELPAEPRSEIGQSHGGIRVVLLWIQSIWSCLCGWLAASSRRLSTSARSVDRGLATRLNLRRSWPVVASAFSLWYGQEFLAMQLRPFLGVYLGAITAGVVALKGMAAISRRASVVGDDGFAAKAILLAGFVLRYMTKEQPRQLVDFVAIVSTISLLPLAARLYGARRQSQGQTVRSPDEFQTP